MFLDDIDPQRLYSFSEAARLIPSSRGGHISLSTMHTWAKAKVFKAEFRQVMKKRMWFVRGAEILRLAGGPPPQDISHIQSPAQRKKSQEAAYAGLRELGVIT